MRIMALTALLQLMSPTPQVAIDLPSAYLTAADLGGTVLVINMKHSIVISKKSSDLLLSDLGEKVRSQVFHDFILGTDPLVLRDKYASYQSAELAELVLRYSRLDIAAD
jgi:hypothetical protein